MVVDSGSWRKGNKEQEPSETGLIRQATRGHPQARDEAGRKTMPCAGRQKGRGEKAVVVSHEPSPAGSKNKNYHVKEETSGKKTKNNR